MTPGPMDVQVILNKTPITEKVQEVMERNAEQRHAHIAAEMAKQNEHDTKTVTKAKGSENPNIDERNRKKHNKEKKKKKSSSSTTGRFIDIEA